jgi:hypothetical protein
MLRKCASSDVNRPEQLETGDTRQTTSKSSGSDEEDGARSYGNLKVTQKARERRKESKFFDSADWAMTKPPPPPPTEQRSRTTDILNSLEKNPKVPMTPLSHRTED